MTFRFRLTTATLVLCAGAWLAAQSARPSTLIDSARLLDDLKTLSADDMAGRQVGTPGGEKARAYVIERFREAGLKPFGDSFTHPFTFRSGRGEAAGDRPGVNVIGRIDGTKHPARFIVISAHYDHVGVRNGVVFNGADDNASGTAALFALATYFAAHRPDNSLIFAAFDAEESGLRGARAFVAAPPVPVVSLALNLNMDMIGRDPDDTLYASGSFTQPFLIPMLDRAASSAPVKLRRGHDNPNEKGVEDWTGSSDHAPFCSAKIPCLYFGVEDFENHHKASDDFETMTHDFYVRAVETMVAVVREFDTRLDEVVKGRQDAGEPVTVDTPTGTLAGTLLLPVSVPRPPVVLLIAGSGPTDRDGNSRALPGKNDNLKMLAEALAAQGMASVRYDKRGLGGSQAALAGGEASVRFETFVDDAAAWITLLRNDVRFPIVAVAGHSEGALVGMLAARMARADGVVSISGIGRRLSTVLREQLRPQLTPLPELWNASESILASLEAGQTVADVPQALATLYRPSVQPFLISILRYAPTEEFARLVVPTLVVQGTTDVQVAVEDARALAAARPGTTLEIIDGMNHVLKAVGGPVAAQMPSYSDPLLPIVPAVSSAIAAFVKALPPLGRNGVGGERPRQARRSPRVLTVGTIDGTRIAIEYGQPQMRGREVWGALVPWRGVWMPGADEATTITTRGAVVIGGLLVPAGDHTLYTVPRADGLTLVISNEVGQFHTIYNESHDLGRVPMALSSVAGAPVEGLTFSLVSAGRGGQLTLSWADRQYSVAIGIPAPATTPF